MAINNLSIDGEFRYIIQWFNEWSELQRDDFVPVLVEYLLQGTTGGVYMNGVINSVANVGMHDKPMSLFQCRIKLFREWNKKWPLEFKHKLKEKIVEMDEKVGAKIVEDIKSRTGQESDNTMGEAGVSAENGTNDANCEAANYADELIATAASIVDATQNAINLDSRIVAVLNRETPVDDNVASAEHIGEGADNTVIVAANMQQDAVEPAEQVQMQANILEENVAVNGTATATVA